MERTDSWERPMTRWSPVPVLAAYYDAVTVICELAAQFSDRAWHQPTPCDDWRAADRAGHLRCVADDYHEYLDDAPVSRLARLMARGPSPESLARKLARQNSAELAALRTRPGRSTSPRSRLRRGPTPTVPWASGISRTTGSATPW